MHSAKVYIGCVKPLMGHKLACLGRAQARTVESWGGLGKCEIVGQPRFDEMMAREHLPALQACCARKERKGKERKGKQASATP